MSKDFANFFEIPSPKELLPSNPHNNSAEVCLQVKRTPEKHITEDLQDFMHANYHVGLAAMLYFAMHYQDPSTEELEGVLQALYTRAQFPPQQVDCFRIAGVPF